jgi:hypothetical protein
MNRGDEDLQKIELPMQAAILVRYSEHDLAAAKAIEENHLLILPYLQMAEQSIELLLKACSRLLVRLRGISAIVSMIMSIYLYDSNTINGDI